jgi:acetolactate synthase I/II/III large subunit
MTGAECIVETLERAGIDVWFANPGTTELHFISALARARGVRSVLGLFEGVVTGAADGYGRMAEKPAVTLLHLGPGFANGIANLHNARRAGTPVINVIGDHPDHHLPYDSPLTSDIESLARPVSGWVRRVTDVERAARDTADAIAAATGPARAVATLIVPADVAWSKTDRTTKLPPRVHPPPPSSAAIASARQALKNGSPTLLLLGGDALKEAGLAHAGRIAAATGCDLLAQTSNARVERGWGRTPVERLPFGVDQAIARLQGYRQVILAGAREPVAFFAYPGKPSALLDGGVEVLNLAGSGENIPAALAWLAEELGAAESLPTLARPQPADAPTGRLTRELIGRTIAHALPEGAIVADESITTGRQFFPLTHAAAPHTWLQLTGGAIGAGMPLATGAAIACPDRKVLNLQADGSGMYTLQSLWTQAREALDVTTIVLSNRSYAILKAELASAQSIEVGDRSHDLVELDRPELDWVSLARGMGVPGERAETAEELLAGLERGFGSEGPYLIEAIFV